MLSTHPTAASTRAQLADTDEAILAFAVTSRQPDRDVHERTTWPGGSNARSASRSAPSWPPAGCSSPRPPHVHPRRRQPRAPRSRARVAARRAPVQRTGPTRPQPAKGTVVLETFTATPDPTSPLPAARSLVDRDEYGPITGRPGGLFTAAPSRPCSASATTSAAASPTGCPRTTCSSRTRRRPRATRPAAPPSPARTRRRPRAPRSLPALLSGALPFPHPRAAPRRPNQ